MAFDLNAVNPRLVEIWERTRQRWPDKVRPDTQPLQEVEKDCGAIFPEDYFDFINTYGSISLQLGEIRMCIVQYAIGKSAKKDKQYAQSISPSNLVRENYMMLSRPHKHYPDVGARIPPKTIPIGVSYGGGEYFLIDLSDEKYGRIWYKSAGSLATWGSEGNTILGFVASSFTEFLAGLMTEDEINRKIAEESR